MPYDERLTGLKASVTITKTNFIHPSHSAKVRDRTIPRNFHSFELRLKKKKKRKETISFLFFFLYPRYIHPSLPLPILHPFRDTRAVITKSTFPVKIAECK